MLISASIRRTGSWEEVRSRRRDEGFTLVEVLVAVAIISIGVFFLMQALPAALRASKIGEMQTAGSLLAASKLDELQSLGYTNIAASASGDFDSLIGGSSNFSGLDAYSWSYVSTEEIPDVLKRVELAVHFTAGANDMTDTYVAYVVDLDDDV